MQPNQCEKSITTGKTLCPPEAWSVFDHESQYSPMDEPETELDCMEGKLCAENLNLACAEGSLESAEVRESSGKEKQNEFVCCLKLVTSAADILRGFQQVIKNRDHYSKFLCLCHSSLHILYPSLFWEG